MNHGKVLVSKSKLFTGITTFMIMIYFFQIDSLLGYGVYQLLIKIPFFVAALYILVNIRFFKPNLTVVLLLTYTAAMALSNYLTSEITLNMIMSISVQAFLFVTIHTASRRGMLRAAVKGLLFYFLIVCAFNDLIWIVHGCRPLVEGNTRLSMLPQFFLGNKFSVMYDHILLSALFLTLYQGRRRRNWIFAIGVILIILSFSFDCATTAVMSFAFMIMLFIEGKKHSLFESKITIGIALATSAIFPFLSAAFIRIGFIQNAIVTVLGRNLTMTGRVNIFTHIIELVKDGLFWGIGRENTTSVIATVAGAANIQNGFWQIAITYGMIPAAFLFFAILSATRSGVERKTSLHSYTMLGVIYAFVLAGFVEITYGITLLMPVALYNELNIQERKVYLRDQHSDIWRFRKLWRNGSVYHDAV